jgi:hypothetical protein
MIKEERKSWVLSRIPGYAKVFFTPNSFKATSLTENHHSIIAIVGFSEGKFVFPNPILYVLKEAQNV